MTPCVEHEQMPGQCIYGRAKRRIRGKVVQLGLHVLALMRRTEEDPDGRMALHTCDNKRCIHGDHLYWGDHNQNMADRAARCTAHMGLPRKATDDQVRWLRVATCSYDDMARTTGLSRTACYNIRSGKTYKEVL